MKKKAFDSQENNLIPRFIGNEKEFNKYLGPHFRNLVQRITKSYKLQIGQCEKCGEKNKQLDAAHVHGKERKEIINSILKDFTVRDSMEINLNVFEERFIEAHNPIKSAIKILCKECHREYDKDIAHKPVNREFSSVDRSAQSTTGRKIKIGSEAQRFFEEYGERLTAETIKKLLSKEYSKNQLGCNFPVLLEREKSPIDNGGKKRYYVGEFVPGYWLCSQWYERNREDFKRFKHKWLKVNK